MPAPVPFRATLTLLVATAACGGAPRPGTPIPESRQGTFRFLERVAGSSPEILIEGELTVRSDTILVNVNQGLCQPAPLPDTQNFRFHCGQLTLSIDRRNPAQRVDYGVRGRGFELRRVCRRTGTDASGRPICLEYGQETVEVEKTFTGRLRLIPNS